MEVSYISYISYEHAWKYQLVCPAAGLVYLLLPAGALYGNLQIAAMPRTGCAYISVVRVVNPRGQSHYALKRMCCWPAMAVNLCNHSYSCCAR